MNGNTPWTPGSTITPPIELTFNSIDPLTISTQEIYRLLVNTVIPRPIAFVSTQSSSGQNNLAPFSFFNAISSNPPTLMISIAVKPDGSQKDTLRNISETGEFVVNSANGWLIDPLVYSAGSFACDIDEMQLVGLTPLASETVKPPRVKEAAVQFECNLYSSLQIGDGAPGSTTVVIGKIQRLHIAESIYNNGKIRTDSLDPIARLGGNSYAKLGPVFQKDIPKV